MLLGRVSDLSGSLSLVKVVKESRSKRKRLQDGVFREYREYCVSGAWIRRQSK